MTILWVAFSLALTLCSAIALGTPQFDQETSRSAKDLKNFRERIQGRMQEIRNRNAAARTRHLAKKNVKGNVSLADPIASSSSNSGPPAYGAACIQFTNCAACLNSQNYLCGWCLSMNLCLPSKNSFLAPTQCPSNFTVSTANCQWSSPTPSDQCTIVGEGGGGTCFECLALYSADGRCGYCAADNTCARGTRSGPSYAPCSGGWQYGYKPGNCAACYAMKTCGACSNMTGCGWCGSGPNGAGTCRMANAQGGLFNSTGCTTQSGGACSAVTPPTSGCGSHQNCGDCIAASTPTGKCSWCFANLTCYDPERQTVDACFDLNSNATCQLCSQYTTATSCIGALNERVYCGWNIMLQVCQAGDRYGPFPPALAPPFFSAWQTRWTTALISLSAVNNCTALTSCNKCASSPYCGWCPVEQICTDGTNFGPGNRALCTNRWHFHPQQCPASPVTCSLSTDCVSCVVAGGGEICAWCAASKTCTVPNTVDCSSRVRTGTNATLACAGLPPGH